MIDSINIKTLKEMFLSGAKFVSNEYEYINELNVFPVPDGDTGTNLKVTIDGACDSIKLVEHNDLSTLGKQFSRGLLMNARGNSGVIFSQIIKGFTNNFKEGQTELSKQELIKSFALATKTAYESMMTPIEGTILTVIRETSEALQVANDQQTESIESILKLACHVAKKTLTKTPEILQELKEAGVVDSGGYGLCCFLNGMLACLDNIPTSNNAAGEKKVVRHIIEKKSFIENLKDKNEGFGYCTEFIMILKSKIFLEQKEKDDFEIKYFKKIMNRYGDSLAVVADENIVKVHIHTKTPYSVLEEASSFGEFSKVKIENMTFQFLENNPGTTLESIEHKHYHKTKTNLSKTVKIIATVPSNEIAKIYKDELKIDNTIITDTIGNPSISDFFKIIKQANSTNLIIVVDDSNIVLAAKEAIKLTPKLVKIELLKANDIGSSYLACREYDNGLDFKLNFRNIESMLERCSSTKISYSIKNIELYGVKIKKNEFIGIFEKKILISSRNMQYVCKKMVDRVVNDVKRPKSAYIFYNKQAKTEDINFVRKYINETHFLKVHVIFGNQDNYPFIICVK